jgi:hypothetical protein
MAQEVLAPMHTEDATRPTVAAMRAHVRELADEFKVLVAEGLRRGDGYLARVSLRTGRVEIPTVRDRRAYFLALHEFGHLAAFRAGEAFANPWQPEPDARWLHDEAWAWAWALDHARFRPTPRIAYRVRYFILGNAIKVLGNDVVAAEALARPRLRPGETAFGENWSDLAAGYVRSVERVYRPVDAGTER